MALTEMKTAGNAAGTGAATSAGGAVAGAPHSAAGQLQTAAHSGEGHFPPFDTAYFASSLLWLAVTFGLFYLFMARVVLPRLGGLLEMRRDRIAADLDQAARMKNESDAAVAAYQKNLAEARDKAKGIARAAAEEAQAKAAAERKQAEGEMEKQLAQSERQLAEARDKAIANVGSMAEAAAAEIIKRLSGKEADGKLIAQAVQNSGRAGSAA